jgi:hypothetical protein
VRLPGPIYLGVRDLAGASAIGVARSGTKPTEATSRAQGWAEGSIALSPGLIAKEVRKGRGLLSLPDGSAKGSRVLVVHVPELPRPVLLLGRRVPTLERGSAEVSQLRRCLKLVLPEVYVGHEAGERIFRGHSLTGIGREW